jgi:hypothetical protein
MTQYSITKYRYVEIVTATNEHGSYYEIPSIHDRHGHPYTCNTITQAKLMITRALHGNSKNYRLSTY